MYLFFFQNDFSRSNLCNLTCFCEDTLPNIMVKVLQIRSKCSKCTYFFVAFFHCILRRRFQAFRDTKTKFFCPIKTYQIDIFLCSLDYFFQSIKVSTSSHSESNMIRKWRNPSLPLSCFSFSVCEGNTC